MKARNSRYIIGGASFSVIARLPAGEWICLTLNPAEQDAQKEVSKSRKAACSRERRSCEVRGGSGTQPFSGRRRAGETRTTHLWVRLLPDVPAEGRNTIPENGACMTVP